ncbi:MAG: molybdopterin cofactor-binding domain-containing protein, partial [Pseudomonadota bacterium]
ADWEKVTVHQLNEDDRRFGNPAFGHVLYTAGSSGVYGYFKVLREAGAHLREMIRTRAATEWGIPVYSLTVSANVVSHPASGKSMSYGDVVALPGFADTSPAQEPKLKEYSEFQLIGKPIKRLDTAAKSTGTQKYAIDVRLPGMLYATVLRSPVEGETVATLDDSDARAVPGVVDVVTLPDGVAVVAETLHASFVGRGSLSVTWTQSSPSRAYSSDTTLQEYEAAARSEEPGAVWRAAGDADSAIRASKDSVTGMYLSDYAYHAQLEPMVAVASVHADGKGAEIWAGTQTQSWTTRTATEVLDTTPERIKLNMMNMGGGFGRRTELMQNYVRDALVCSRIVKKPVKVIWAREDDLKHGAFRPAAAQYMRAGLDETGHLAAWHHRVATPSVIAYFNPIRWAQVKPKDIISMRGAEAKFYDTANFLAEHVVTERHARVLPWRGIGAAYTSFASEAFMDEVAEKAGKTPLDFRKSLMTNNARGSALLDKVAAMASETPTEQGHGRGMAFAGYGETQVAGIADISVDRDSGEIRVHHIWTAVDAGLIISHDNSLNQVEGGVVFGVSSALYERITITNGEVDQNNFYDYSVVRHSAVPQIEVHLMENNEKPTQVGEAGTPMVAAAIA